MSVNITIDHAVKKYGNNTVIPDLSLVIRNGEFFTLLGPSGCGKTTLLRMIAGFNSIEGGTFRFNDKTINHLDPGKRNIGMVFQNYAIFPNMTVRKNVAFGLKQKKIDKPTIQKETEHFMKLVHVNEYADRMPNQLSGGQQQRVALARALVIRPDVLLMDEPLSNLDAKLRVEMRTVIRQIQRNVGITTVYVTHDQEEAMAISDRIAVMNAGVIHHCGKPKNIYQRPADMFVANFIGKSNLLDAELQIIKGKTFLVFKNNFKLPMNNIKADEAYNRKVKVSVRPEEFIVEPDGQEGIRATVDDCVFLGLNTHYFVTLETGEKAEIVEESSIDTTVPAGTKVMLTLKNRKINLFDPDSTKSIMEGVENSVFPEKTDEREED